jgi:surfeit locus 1 family protein
MVFRLLKSFRPGKLMTLVLFLLAFLFATLGTWQTNRATDKAAIEQEYRAATALPLELALARDARFARVEVNGEYDSKRHILLDNQIWQGRAGVYVFTPFYTVGGTTILVNRGWLPLAADRKSLPQIPTPQHATVLKGMLNTPPVAGRILGSRDELRKDDWPQLVTYLNLADISASLGAPLEARIIQLSQSEPDGFEGRDWKPVFLNSSRHRGYAFQWFALMVASIVMWLVSGFRNPSGHDK